MGNLVCLSMLVAPFPQQQCINLASPLVHFSFAVLLSSCSCDFGAAEKEHESLSLSRRFVAHTLPQRSVCQ